VRFLFFLWWLWLARDKLVFLGMVFPWDVTAGARGEAGGMKKETLNHE
jgi:hypothetical protein